MWERSVNGNQKQKLYGHYLVREMNNSPISGLFKEYWVLNLSFLGMIVLQTNNLRLAIKTAKTLK